MMIMMMIIIIILITTTTNEIFWVSYISHCDANFNLHAHFMIRFG